MRGSAVLSLSLALLCASSLLVSGVSADVCAQANTCGQCESMDAGWNCGWCASAASCLTGGFGGPNVGACANGWSFQRCPTDQQCYNIGGDCTTCLQQPNCYYCQSSGSCQPGATGPIPGGSTCNSVYSGSPSVCSGGAPDSPSYPAAGIVANVFLVITSLFWLLRMMLYCCTRGWTPVMGIRLRAGVVAMVDYTRGSRLAVPFFVAGVSLVMKIASLGVDRWDVFELDSDDIGINLTWYWGLLKIHFSQPMQFGPNDSQSSISYKDFCALLGDPNDPTPDPTISNSQAMCHTLRAAGILCLVMGILSVVCSALTALYGLFLLARQTTIPSKGVFGWRVAGFANMCTIASFLYWIASAHVIIMHNLNDLDGSIWVGASYWLMLGAWVLDFGLLIFMRRAVAFTAASGEGGIAVGAVPYAVLAPAPMGFAHQQQQQRPQGYAHGQPQQYAQQPQQQQAAYNPYAVPQGYAPPPQGYAQPPQGYAQPQPYVQQQQRGF